MPQGPRFGPARADQPSVCISSLRCDGPARFRFLCREGAEDRPQIRALRDWILAEIEKTAYISDRFTIIPVEDVAAP